MNKHDKLVVILRGAPGSGKSTWAKNNYPEAVVCSADDFWLREVTGDSEAIIVQHNGREMEYEVDELRMPEAHCQCLSKFVSLIESEEPVIIVDNTNIFKWEYLHYKQIAHAFKYSVKVVEFRLVKAGDIEKLSSRNVHGVLRPIIIKNGFEFQRDCDDMVIEALDHSNVISKGKII